LRRFVVRSLTDFGAGRASLEGKVPQESEALVAYFRKQNGQPFDCADTLTNTVANVICSIIFGRRYEYGEPEFVYILGVLKTAYGNQAMSPIHLYPWLKKIFSRLTGIDEVKLKIENFIRTIIERHQATHKQGHPRDFIDLYLDMEYDEEESNKFSAPDFFTAIRDLFTVGMETTTTSIRWFLVFMINHPEIQEKCRKEIMEVIGQSRPPSMQDRHQMTYTFATIQETLRMGGTAEGAPRTCSSPVEVGGYTIPKDAIVFTVFRSCLRDASIWGDPEVFRPERWIEDGKLKPTNEAFLPFSVGRRSCPGEQIARMALFIFNITLLQKFRFEPAGDMPSMVPQQVKSYVPLKYTMRAIPLDEDD